MYYYIHEIYGYIVASEPPLRNLEDYQPITEEEYNAEMKRREEISEE